MSLSAGTRLGPYEVVSRLGAGGMGEVWRARDARLDRDVAVKVIHPQLAADADRISRFEREARAAARLDHPNVLVVHDVGVHEGSPYIVSEFLEGETLRERLGAPLSPKAAVAIAIQIAQGLAAAHELGIVHRDLKPENVFIKRDGRVKILDFGVAKLTQPSSESVGTSVSTLTATEPGSVMGTVGYMSPEQVQGRPVDARTDLFSLGVVLYEMLSGKRPFQRGTTPETLTAILREEPPDLSEANRHVTPALDRVVRRCLEKEPARRFRDAQDVATALEFLTGSVDTRPAAPMTAAGVFLHRHRAAAAAVAIVAVLAVLVALWSRTRGPGAGAVRTRLAVLPFENLTGDPEQTYLADGIHESLITDLARLSGFSRVIARPSVMSYVKTTKPLAQIGKELGVDTLVTGSVMRAAAKLKVTAHLINAENEEHLWSESFEREPGDILTLQNEIVRAIATKAKLALTPVEKARLASARPVSPEAYESYLKGRFQLNKMSPEGFEKGLAYLNKAVELDPTNPLPQAALALAYARIGHDRYPDFFARARDAAAKAEALGGEPLAEMFEALGEIKLLSDWDYAGAAKDILRAMELNPSLGDPHRMYSWYLTLVGRGEEALAEMRRAQELDPLTPLYYADRGWQLWWMGRNDEALAESRKCLEIDPKFAYGMAVAGYVLAEMRRHDEAIAEHVKAAEGDAAWRWCVARTYALAGRTVEARNALARGLGQEPKAKGAWDGWFLAETYAALGEKDEAFRWLEASYRERHSFMPWIAHNPAYAPLRADPRFGDLVRRMNLPKG